jgi:hypothetical protein
VGPISSPQLKIEAEDKRDKGEDENTWIQEKTLEMCNE